MGILKWFIGILVTLVVGAALIISAAIFGQLKHDKDVADAPGIVVDTFFTSVIAGDLDAANACVSPVAAIDYGLDISNKNYKRMLNWVTYTMDSSTIDNDMAIVNVTITAPDLEAVFPHLIDLGTTMVQGEELPTAIEMSIIRETDSVLRSKDLPYVVTQVAVNLLMVEGKWLIVGDYDITEALLAGRLYEILEWQADLDMLVAGEMPVQEIAEEPVVEEQETTTGSSDSSAIIVPNVFLEDMIGSLTNQEELNAALAVTLNSKLVAENQVSFDFAYTNGTEQDISSFICLIVFEDTEQNPQIAFNFTYNAMLLQANSTYMGIDLTFVVDEEKEEQIWLRDVDDSELVMKVYPTSISFTDGTNIGQ